LSHSLVRLQGIQMLESRWSILDLVDSGGGAAVKRLGWMAERVVGSRGCIPGHGGDDMERKMSGGQSYQVLHLCFRLQVIGAGLVHGLS
jgi:hypothetical protein